MTAENLRIITLGNFDISKNGQSLLSRLEENSGGLTELLKLLITFRDKKLLPEILAQQRWRKRA